MKHKWVYFSLVLLMIVVSISIWYFYFAEEKQVVYKGTFVNCIDDVKG